MGLTESPGGLNRTTCGWKNFFSPSLSVERGHWSSPALRLRLTSRAPPGFWAFRLRLELHLDLQLSDIRPHGTSQSPQPWASPYKKSHLCINISYCSVSLKILTVSIRYDVLQYTDIRPNMQGDKLLNNFIFLVWKVLSWNLESTHIAPEVLMWYAWQQCLWATKPNILQISLEEQILLLSTKIQI